MIFTNEIPSEEDVKNFGLDKLLKKFNSWAWRDGQPSVFQHSWTVNENHDVFLVKVGAVDEVGPSGRLEPTNKDIFVLNYQGNEHEVLLEKLNDSSSNFSDSPFKIHWKFLEVKPDSSALISESDLQSVIMQALQTYGHRGALRQVPNTIVVFNSGMVN